MLSLYEATVPGFRQTIEVLRNLLAKGRSFCGETGIDPEDLAGTRLCANMLPLRFQVRAALHFCLGSIAALQTGRIGTPADPTFYAYDALESLLDDALGHLDRIAPRDIDEYAAATVIFEAGDRSLAFTGQDLLLSFAIPNLHFHATTAYDILRMRGVALRKHDYLGRMAIMETRSTV